MKYTCLSHSYLQDDRGGFCAICHNMLVEDDRPQEAVDAAVAERKAEVEYRSRRNFECSGDCPVCGNSWSDDAADPDDGYNY